MDKCHRLVDYDYVLWIIREEWRRNSGKMLTVSDIAVVKRGIVVVPRFEEKFFLNFAIVMRF